MTAKDFIETELEFEDDVTNISVPFFLNDPQRRALEKYESKSPEILFTKKRAQGITLLSLAYASYLASKKLNTLIVCWNYAMTMPLNNMIANEYKPFVKIITFSQALQTAIGKTFECIIFDEFYHIRGFEYIKDSLRPHTKKIIMYTSELPDRSEEI